MQSVLDTAPKVRIASGSGGDEPPRNPRSSFSWADVSGNDNSAPRATSLRRSASRVPRDPDPDPDDSGDDDADDDDDREEEDDNDYFRDTDPNQWDDEADACDHARQANTIRSSRKSPPDGGDDDDGDGDDDPDYGPGGGDASGPTGPGSRHVISPKKIKEAESIKIAAFPEPVQFRTWKASVRTEVTAAAGPGRSDPAFHWILSVDELSFKQLYETDEFESLDTKLAAALMKAQRGELGRQMTIKEQAMAKDGKRLKGRQMPKMLYDYHKLDETQHAVYNFENILAVTLKGDKLQKFLNDWNSTLAGQGTSITKKILKPLLLRELRKSPQLKEEIAHYDRAKPNTEDNSYDYLYRALCRRIELNRQQQFRATLLAHQAKGDDLPPGTPGPRPKAKAKGKGGGRADGGDASRARQRSSSQASRAPAGHCFPTGTPVPALVARSANTSISVLQTLRLRRKGRGHQRRPHGHVPTVLVHLVPRKRLAYFCHGNLRMGRPMCLCPRRRRRCCGPRCSRSQGEKQKQSNVESETGHTGCCRCSEG